MNNTSINNNQNKMDTEWRISDAITYIRPDEGGVGLNWRELWDNREILYLLTWRDIISRYKQTLLGYAWSILVPLINMLVFGTIFGLVAKLPSSGLNPYLFYLAGIVPWQYFSNATTSASNSLVNNADLLKKIYLPRLFLPLASCFSKLIDFVIAYMILLLIMFWYGILPAGTIVIMPLLLLEMIVLCFGLGLIFSCLNVRFRDTGIILPFIVQIWMYFSIVFPFDQIPARWGLWRYLYGVNPMAGIIEANRWCLMHHVMGGAGGSKHSPEAPLLLVLAGFPFILAVLLGGLYYFKRTENTFADIV